MDSPQSVVSPFKNLSVSSEPAKLSDFLGRSSSFKNKEQDAPRNGFIGVLDVYIHQARDIQNICIYHKQDVYAKLCLTSDPENAVSTKIINGGGQNPVFNDSVRLNVRTVDSSLKCEIWMMSRVRNYLEDQSLGFALVPMSELFVQNGKVEKEFSLSSTDLLHSHSGFVQLSLSYIGASPEVMAIPARGLAVNAAVQDSETTESETSDFSKIEFPDPKVVNENELMVSEYFGIPHSSLEDSQSSDSLVSSDNENLTSPNFRGTVDSKQFQKLDSPPRSVAANGPSSASSQASDDHVVASMTLNQEHGYEKGRIEDGETDSFCSAPLPTSNASVKQTLDLHVELEQKGKEVGDGKTDSSISASVQPSDASEKPVLKVNVPEQKVVQQDIVDMYMKSMQQFTQSLAEMKLPLDIENGPPSSGSSSTEQNLQGAKNSGSSRVFYGSRAFF